MNKDKKPRDSSLAKDHLANERTFLAWIRTGLGIMAFGFVIEKFALFLKQVTSLVGKSTETFSKPNPSIFGVAIVIIGVVISICSFIQYRTITRQIDEETYRPTTLLNLLLTLSIILIGLFIILYWDKM